MYSYFGESVQINFPSYLNSMGFAAFSYAMENWWGNQCISHTMEDTTGWESNGKKDSYFGNCMGTNFPCFPQLMGFTAFSHAIGNYEKTHALSHMMKYTIGWESNGKKTPILWVPVPLNLLIGFCCILPCYGKLMGKPMYFPYHEIH